MTSVRLDALPYSGSVAPSIVTIVGRGHMQTQLPGTMKTITFMVSSFYMLSSLFPLFWSSLCVSALHVEMRGELVLSPTAKREHISGLENGQNLNYMVNIALWDSQSKLSSIPEGV